MNLPNKLTVARCFMAGIFVLLMSFPSVPTYVIAYIVFTAAAITDHYDGKIARERNLITNFGKLLDPVADKVLVVAALIMLMKLDGLWIPGWTIIVILAREFLVTGARSLAAADGEVIAAIASGKTKTVLQLVYVFVFLLYAIFLQVLMEYPAIISRMPGDGVGSYLHIGATASLIGIVLVALYTVYSGVQFARVNWKILKLDNLS
jgi:CDP-diacylglycerol--glycerol-3-phosphate 3-phosphatidyltransferase